MATCSIQLSPGGAEMVIAEPAICAPGQIGRIWLARQPLRPCASCTVATPAAAEAGDRPARGIGALAMGSGTDDGRWSVIAFLGHRRGAVGVEGLDRLQPPGLALLAVGLGPDHRLPVGREDQPGAGIGQFDPVARRLPDIEEERALDRVLVRAGLDMDAVLQEDVGGAQDVLALVGGIGDMVQPAMAAAALFGADQIVGLVVAR